MAFGGATSLGATGSTGNNQASLALTLTLAGVAVGELAVVAVADDNIGTGADADGGEVASVSDNATGGSNTWVKAKGWTLTTGGAQNGAAISLWYTVAQRAIPITTGTITATFTNASLSDATAMTGYKFTIAAGVAINVEASNQSTGTAATSPGSLTATTANIECLRIRAFACEVGNNTNLTNTASWTAWANGNSTTTGTIAEMVARAEHRISTTTSDASNPTYAITADYAHVYVALREDPLPAGQRERFPVPPGPKRAVGLLTPIEFLATPLTLIQPPASPLPAYLWTPPDGARFPPSLRLAHPALTAPVIPPGVEVGDSGLRVTVWTPPDGPRWPIILRRWLQTSTALQLTPPEVAAPFIPYDWPIPRRARSVNFLNWTARASIAAGVGGQPFSQDDWPVPRKRGAASFLGWTVQAPPAEAVVAADAPFAQYDWPVPRRARAVNLLSWTVRAPPGEAAVSIPFAQDDWPLPRGKPRSAWQLGWPNTVIGPVPAVKPFAKYDWPVPRRVPRSVALLSWRAQANPVAAGPKPFFQSYWPVPRGKPPTAWLQGWANEVIGPVPPAPAGPACVPFTWDSGQTWDTDWCWDTGTVLASNRWVNPRTTDRPLELLTTLNAGIEQTFSGNVLPSYVWGNPLPKWPGYSLGWHNSVIGPVPTGVAPGPKPFLQTSWPVPRQNDWPLELFTNLNGGISSPKPFAQNDWPVPRGRPRDNSVYSFTRSSIKIILPPHRQRDWPLPRRPLHPVSLRTTATTGTTGKLQPPFAQDDWPNPRGTPQVRYQVQGLTAASLQGPFAQTDWPNPRPYLRPVTLLTFSQSPIVIEPPPRPTAQLDWPLPGRDHPSAWQGWITPSIAIGVAAIPKPFAQYNWPVPKGPVTNLLGWSNKVIGPVPPAAQPPNQHDWPLPYPGSWPLELLTVVNAGIENPQPFAQNDWPVPKGKAYPSDLRQWSQIATTASRQTPFAKTDWPNPQLPRRKPSFYDFLQSDIRLHPPTPLPFRQDSWPVPKAARFPIEIAGLNSGTMPQEAPTKYPFVQHNWPVPKGRRATVETLGINAGALPRDIPPAPEIGVGGTWLPLMRRRGRR